MHVAHLRIRSAAEKCAALLSQSAGFKSRLSCSSLMSPRSSMCASTFRVLLAPA